MVLIIFFISLILFGLAYKFYGNFLSKKFDISDNNQTPAHTLRDDIDFVPTRPLILFGHHFSSIAGAGPILGPIIAASMFGWLPAILWIVLGSIFIGGVHDFSSLVASIRHKAKSIAEIANEYLGKLPYKMFLLFIWLTLVYVLIVFLDLTASNFVQEGSVATSSFIYIILAILFGLTIYRLKLNFTLSTIIFVILTFFGIYIGTKYKMTFPKLIFNNSQETASVILIFYMFFASVLPVWLLLQPRDYLSSFLLYTSVLVGILGVLFGNFKVNYPAFISFQSNNQFLFPFLFVTIACGAISGFHSLIASGTTSKQLNKESDAIKIGYAGMLMEGIVAVIALITIIITNKESAGGMQPAIIYSNGICQFLSIFKIPVSFGKILGLMILTSFLLTTLDTATRLGRYILQEFFDWDIRKTRIIATLITLVLPTLFIFLKIKDAQGNVIPAWKAIWPIFGSTNQLLAALTLLVITLWLSKMKKNYTFTLIPMIFMFIVTLTALFLLIFSYKISVIGIIGGILFLLAIYLFGFTILKLKA